MTGSYSFWSANQAQDYQSHRYRSVDQAWVNWREQRLVGRLLTECGLINGSLLDVPCGYGRFFPLLTRLGMTVTGIDIDRNMVQLAVHNAAPHDQGRGICASLFALPFADDAFDGVLCIRLLHHRYTKTERLRLLGELARVSRRIVLLSFYRTTPLHALARHWRGPRGRLEMLSFVQFHNLVSASGLRFQRVCSLLKFCHAQTFVVLSKNPIYSK